MSRKLEDWEYIQKLEEENERRRGLIEQQAGQLEEEQSQTVWLREQVIELKELNERLRAKVERLESRGIEDMRHRIEAALEHCAQASVLLGQSNDDAEAAKYVGLALKALKGEEE